MAKRVVIGLSGGVDSAVSALLLKKRGYEVIGVHMVNWDSIEEGTSNCTRSKDENDARNISHRLNIPFHSVNFVKEYWNEVFIKMLDGYSKGRTVVPDIQCNRSIKFEHLHKMAKERFNADFIATGHYSTTSNGDYNDGNSQRYRLLRGIDPLKDQSYFLCTLREEQLKRSIFPLGSFTKKEVKEIAKENGMEDIANRRESMGVCFVGKRKDFGEFLQEYMVCTPGKIIDRSNGIVLGEHNGIHNFTIGKRLSIGPRSHLGYFVQDIDSSNHIVYAVESSTHPSLYATQFIIETPEWIVDSPIKEHELTCRVQRSHPPIDCCIDYSFDMKRITVTPSLPLRSIAYGQMCVFYKGRECLGGGEVIEVTRTL